VARTGIRLEQSRLALVERLQGRREEIEAVVLTRVYAISDPTETKNPSYTEGLRAAVSAALDYGIDGMVHGESRPPSIPSILLDQARLAARDDVGLDVVLRRYFAGYTLLGDFLVEETAKDGQLSGAALKRVLRSQAILLDRLFAAVTDTYTHEAESRVSRTAPRGTEQVKRLLAGELVELRGFAYEFEGFHLGAIATGPGAAETMDQIVAKVDCRQLLVSPEKDTVWAWLGGRHPLDASELVCHMRDCSVTTTLALGFPGRGLSGWRLTHQQAAAALPIAALLPGRTACYADVALLASIRRDEVLTASLRSMYLDPLKLERDGGEALRRTLRAYFAAQRNSASTAAALGVTRQTVNNRLRAVEQRLRQQLGDCAAELEIALRLDELRLDFPAGKLVDSPFVTSARQPPSIQGETTVTY